MIQDTLTSINETQSAPPLNPPPAVAQFLIGWRGEADLMFPTFVYADGKGQDDKWFVFFRGSEEVFRAAVDEVKYIEKRPMIPPGSTEDES